MLKSACIETTHSTAMATHKSLAQSLANIAFIALFPGFFLYHTAIGTGSIPDFAGGYFSPTCLFLLPLLVFTYTNSILPNKGEKKSQDVLFFLFLAYFSVIVATNFIGGASREVLLRHALAILQFATCYLTFRMLDISSNSKKSYLLALLVLMSALVFYLSSNGSFYLKKDDSFHEDSTATYEGFARSFLVTAIFVVPHLKKFRTRALFYVICTAALYLNSARSEFVCFIIFSLTAETLLSKRRIVTATLIAATASISAWILLSDTNLIPENRILELVNASDSSSWELRRRFLEAALNTISNNPIMGDYASYATIGSGAYAHNLISSWVDLGIVGFLYLAAIISVPLLDMIKIGLKKKGASRQPFYVVTIGLLLITFIMAAGSKTFTTMFIAIAFGAYANYKSKNREYIATKGTHQTQLPSSLAAERQ